MGRASGFVEITAGPGGLGDGIYPLAFCPEFIDGERPLSLLRSVEGRAHKAGTWGPDVQLLWEQGVGGGRKAGLWTLPARWGWGRGGFCGKLALNVAGKWGLDTWRLLALLFHPLKWRCRKELVGFLEWLHSESRVGNESLQLKD